MTSETNTPIEAAPAGAGELVLAPDALLGAASINWFKIALTYCVPYLVCTYGAMTSMPRA